MTDPVENTDIMEDSFHSRESPSSPPRLNEDFSEEEAEEEFQPGPLGNKFMDTEKIIELMKGPHDLLPEIPVGRKDGMYFFVA